MSYQNNLEKMIVSRFKDRNVGLSRIMGPPVELNLLKIVVWYDREEAPRPQDHTFQFISGSRQFATCKFSLSSDLIGRLYGGLIPM
jgi:hypothetical protein